MTVTPIRPNVPSVREEVSTFAPQALAALDALDRGIASIDDKLADPQGWAELLESEKAELVRKREALIASLSRLVESAPGLRNEILAA